MTTITIQIFKATSRGARSQFADAVIHIVDTDLGTPPPVGLARGRESRGRKASFSERQFSVRGCWRSFSPLRWAAKRKAQERLQAVPLKWPRKRQTNGDANEG
jgi:hypothetical protein